jgi:hypothetical protein
VRGSPPRRPRRPEPRARRSATHPARRDSTRARRFGRHPALEARRAREEARPTLATDALEGEVAGMPTRRIGGLVRGIFLVDHDRQPERRQREPRGHSRPDRQPGLPLAARPPRGPALAGGGGARATPPRLAETRPSRAAQARASSISGARTNASAARASPDRRSMRSPRSRPVTSPRVRATGGRQRGQRGRRARADARWERSEHGLPPRARRLRRRPARELEQRRGQRGDGIEDGRQRLEILVPWARAGLDRDHDPRTGTAAEGDPHALPRGDTLLQLRRDAIREGPGNGKDGDDVREQEVRPQAPAGARPWTRSCSRRMSLRSSYAWRR